MSSTKTETKTDDKTQQHKVPEKADPSIITICYLATTITNLLNFVFPIPIAVQLFVNSIACIFIGSYRGAILHHKLDKEEKSKLERMTTKDAWMFPVYGSCVLFGLYMVYKTFDKDMLNKILSVHFTFFGFLSLLQLVSYHLEKVFPLWRDQIVIDRKFTLKLPFLTKEFDICVKKSELIAGIISTPPTVAYFATKHWLLNNLFGIAFSIGGIESLLLPNFQVGFILLWGLFFYDIFWVYGTDVMLTVAKSVDAPIKLIHPINLHLDEPKFSMLGLGDIVIPGVFVALCLKYDVQKALLTKFKDSVESFDFNKVKTTYFKWCMGGYALGIIATFNAMVIFNHAQPALLFLVPGCTFSVLLCALKHKEIKALFEYNEEQAKDEFNNEQTTETQKEATATSQ